MNSPDVSASGKRARSSKSTSGGSVATSRRRTTAAPISAEERRRMIEVCAYFIAEERGFAPGCDQQDWLEAESRIDTMLAPPRGGGSTRRTKQ